jgi:hypothetical protein
MNQGGKLGVVEGLLTFNSKKRDLCTSINCHLSRDQLYKDNAIMYGDCNAIMYLINWLLQTSVTYMPPRFACINKGLNYNMLRVKNIQISIFMSFIKWRDVTKLIN